MRARSCPASAARTCVSRLATASPPAPQETLPQRAQIATKTRSARADGTRCGAPTFAARSRRPCDCSPNRGKQLLGLRAAPILRVLDDELLERAPGAVLLVDLEVRVRELHERLD